MRTLTLDLSPPPVSQCVGKCDGCGKIHIRIYENHRLASREMNDVLEEVLGVLKLPYKIISTASPDAATMAGVSAFPALMLEGDLVCEGYVPSKQQVVTWLTDRFSDQLKIHRMKTITVPVDMSPESANALRYAWQMAHDLNSNLEVVYVMDSIFEGSKASASGFLSGYSNTMQSELDAFIRTSLQAEKGWDSEKTASKVLFGFPDASLIAHSVHSDLMVIGANGHGRISRRVFGSVSAEVSRSARCPVLMVPDGATWYGLKDIVYTSDFTSLDPVRIVEAGAFAQRFGAEMHFVHVSMADEVVQNLQSKFEAVMSMLPFNLRKTVIERVTGDSVIEALYEYAASHKADLLVFVAHERRFWESLMHKSITSEILADAKMPVLVMHDADEVL